MSKFRLFILLLSSVLSFPILAYKADEGGVEVVDSLDQEVRESPSFQENISSKLMPHSIDGYANFPFIKLESNKIDLNGADWSGFSNLFKASADTLISIVHIGDSHIQAEGSTSRTRELLQQRYGSAGRGLIIPFKLAGTNQPLDYSISSDAKFTVAKILKRPWPIDMGFTGISLQPESKNYDLTISLKNDEDKDYEFELVKIFGEGRFPKVVSVLSPFGEEMDFEAIQEDDALCIYLSYPVPEITFKFHSQGECEIFGFLLDNLMMGIQYSAIGNNGATFSSYNSIGCLGSGISALEPNLVIISLGTNEAFGKIDSDTFYNNIDVLVRNVQQSNPDALILLTTPAECQRSSSRRTGKGKRRRTVKSFSVNANIPRLRQAIIKYGQDHSIAVWDWYEVAGGSGASDLWVQHELMAKDRIHNNWSGYALQGNLLFDALIDIIEQ